LINELSKIYGLKLKGESTRKIFKNISINNLCLGVTQVGINTSFNLIKKVILLTAPFTNGLSLLPLGPIAIIQAAVAVQSTKIIGKLAAKEIFIRSKFIKEEEPIKAPFLGTKVLNDVDIDLKIVLSTFPKLALLLKKFKKQLPSQEVLIINCFL